MAITQDWDDENVKPIHDRYKDIIGLLPSHQYLITYVRVMLINPAGDLQSFTFARCLLQCMQQQPTTEHHDNSYRENGKLAIPSS